MRTQILIVHCREFADIDFKVKQMAQYWRDVEVKAIKYFGGEYSITLLATNYKQA